MRRVARRSERGEANFVATSDNLSAEPSDAEEMIVAGDAGAAFNRADLLGCGFAAIALILVFGFPGQVLRSLRRWFGDEPQHAPTRPSPISAEALSARMRRLARPTLLLVPAADGGFSKLGGDPELPPEMAWPRGRSAPLTFFGQIDLAAVASQGAIDWLPGEGYLYAFYDPGGSGLPEAVEILHSRAPGVAPTPTPKGATRLPERKVAFLARISTPSLDWLGLDAAELGLTESEYEAVERIGDAPLADRVQHRIGGYPNEIQPERLWLRCEHLARGLPEPGWDEPVPTPIARAAKEWRLLLQFDSDPRLGTNFGDGGRGWIFVRERDARRGEFRNTVALWQTH